MLCTCICALELTCCDTCSVSQQCHTLLYVYNLPANKDGKSISNRLRRLSDNCGGKVLSISGCTATLRFTNQDSAERAQKRMENEDVFGNRIIVSFTPKTREFCEAKSSSAVTEKVKSPKKLKNPKLYLIKDASEQPSSAKAAPGKGPPANSGPAAKHTHVRSLQVIWLPLASGVCGRFGSCVPVFYALACFWRVLFVFIFYDTQSQVISD